MTDNRPFVNKAIGKLINDNEEVKSDDNKVQLKINDNSINDSLEINKIYHKRFQTGILKKKML